MRRPRVKRLACPFWPDTTLALALWVHHEAHSHRKDERCSTRLDNMPPEITSSVVADLKSRKYATHAVHPDGLSHAPWSDPHREVAADDDSRTPHDSTPGARRITQNRYAIACALMASLGGVSFGYDQGVISIILTLPVFQQRYGPLSPQLPHNEFYKGLMTAMIELGAFIGALNTGWIADRFSRRYSMLTAVVVFLIGSTMQTAAMDYATLVIGRFVGGVAIGMLSMVCPLYIAETAPASLRGTLLALEEWSIVFGIVLAYWITYGTRLIGGGASEWTFRLPFLLQIVPAIVLGIGACILPYSPRWLASVGRDEDALLALGRLRCASATQPDVRVEWLGIRAEAVFQREALAKQHPLLTKPTVTLWRTLRLELAQFGDLLRSSCRRRTMVGVVLMLFQQWVGINALIYYAPTIFGQLGLEYELSLILSGVMNVMQLVGVSIGLLLMDNVGRRALLLWGAMAMTVCHTIVAAVVGLYSDDWAHHMPAGYTGAAFIFIFMLAFGLSWGPVPWSMPAEIFPGRLRAKGVAASTCSNWLFNWVVGASTPVMLRQIGFGTYVFFAAMCIAAGIWVCLCVPETKGRTLEDMDQVFGDGAGGAMDDLRKRQIYDNMVREDALDGWSSMSSRIS